MNDILTMRTDLANQFAAAGAKLLDFTMTAGALAAIPNTMPQQYAVAGSLESISAVLPAAESSHPQRRMRHGDRPTEPLSFEDAGAQLQAAAPSDSDWMLDRGLIYRLNDQGANCDEINVTMAHGSRSNDARYAAASQLLAMLARQQAAPAISEGYALVPKVPTRDMIAKTVDIVFDGAIEDAEVISEIYAAMLAAAPSPIHQEKAAPSTELKDAFAQALHYPECWDTAAYPALSDALAAVYEHFKCSQEKAAPTADEVRANALEEAAKACESLTDYNQGGRCYEPTRDDCVDKIRALKAAGRGADDVREGA